MKFLPAKTARGRIYLPPRSYLIQNDTRGNDKEEKDKLRHKYNSSLLNAKQLAEMKYGLGPYFISDLCGRVRYLFPTNRFGILQLINCNRDNFMGY
ncbi:hypothetical protein CDAR_369681 [Caerostris darwini]|uniref:Uncharacterized protein n=1 Tax=Caerostris darwini TaxID=1538125 RepID=A0AAV4M4F3_9ARAC|nr:hypothetical protein CDAR_369681 [Caerostris darwini]